MSAINTKPASAEQCAVLAIDSAFDICSVACLSASVSIVKTGTHKRKHADDVLLLVQSLLDETQMSLGDFDAIAMTSGPGSFTGLRIGTAVVQGLAFGSSRPVVCISSLAALAHATVAMKPGARVVTCLHARENEFYFAIYQQSESGSPEPVVRDCIATPEQISAHLQNVISGTSGTCLAAGDGWLQPALQELQQKYTLTVVSTSYDALVLADIARHKLVAGHAVPAAMASPVYLKDELEYRTV